MSLTVRRAEARDLPAVYMLLRQVLEVHHKGRPDLFKGEGTKYTDEELLAIFRDEASPVFVCEDGEGKVLGHCFCQTQEHPERPNTYAYKSLYIDDLCVDEAARGRGVGRTLYNYVKGWAAERGYYNVTLHAWECNPAAVGFYKHLGLGIQQYTMEEVLDRESR